MHACTRIESAVLQSTFSKKRRSLLCLGGTGVSAVTARVWAHCTVTGLKAGQSAKERTDHLQDIMCKIGDTTTCMSTQHYGCDTWGLVAFSRTLLDRTLQYLFYFLCTPPPPPVTPLHPFPPRDHTRASSCSVSVTSPSPSRAWPCVTSPRVGNPWHYVANSSPTSKGKVVGQSKRRFGAQDLPDLGHFPDRQGHKLREGDYACNNGVYRWLHSRCHRNRARVWLWLCWRARCL